MMKLWKNTRYSAPLEDCFVWVVNNNHIVPAYYSVEIDDFILPYDCETVEITNWKLLDSDDEELRHIVRALEMIRRHFEV